MAGKSERELTGNEIDFYWDYLDAVKLADEHTAALNVAKALMKKIAGDAEVLTIDGIPVLTVTTTYPNRFDSAALRAYDARLYEQFMRPSDHPVITLRRVSKP